MALPPTRHPAALLLMGRRAVHLSREEVGERLGWSKRTMGRWESGRTAVYPDALAKLAAMVHPVDPVLAEEMTRAAGVTLESIGVPPPATASPRVFLEAIVCVAADAMKTVPETARAGLLAGFRRARELGLTVEDVEKGLTETQGG